MDGEGNCARAVINTRRDEQLKAVWSEDAVQEIRAFSAKEVRTHLSWSEDV